MGNSDGTDVGSAVGAPDCSPDGLFEGKLLGLEVGNPEGKAVGCADGTDDGSSVGLADG